MYINHGARRFIICILLVTLISNLTFIRAETYETKNDPLLINDVSNYFYSIPNSQLPRLIGYERHIFTMQSSSLTSLLTTKYTTKYFYKSDLDESGSVGCVGTLTTNNGYSAHAGICVENPNSGSFEAKTITEFVSGQFSASEYYPVSQMSDSAKYLGYINGSGTDGTTGSVQFWWYGY